MAVIRRAGTQNWFIEFTHLGTTVRRSSGTPVKAKAKELEAEWRRQIYERQRLGKAPASSLGEAIERYYATVLEPTGKTTKLRKDLYCLNAIRVHFGPEKRLDALRQADVAEWRDAMVRDNGRSAAAANRMWAYLRAVLICARDQWGEDVPTIHLRALKEPPGRVRFLSAAEEQDLLDACAPALRGLVTVLLDSGMRKGEAMSLKWSDVAWDGARAILQIRADETKTSKSRRIPLTRRASEVLAKLRAKRPKALNHVFVLPVRNRGNRLTAGANPRTGFEAACRRAEITDFKMHDTRHCYAAKLAQRGATLHQIRELLGHTSIKMVQRYAHLIPSNLDQAVNLLDDAA